MSTNHVSPARTSSALILTYLSRRCGQRAQPSLGTSVIDPRVVPHLGLAMRPDTRVPTLASVLPSLLMAGAPEQRIRCVGAVVLDDAGRLLLIRRANEPGRGRWSVPGGRVEAGETDHQALIREVAEETGLAVEITRWLGDVHRPAPDGAVLDIHDYSCRVIGGTLRAGDDAGDARWCDAETLASLPIVTGLVEALTHWHCLPR